MLGVGGQHYEPEFAHLGGSIGPRSGFQKICGREITGANAAWCEAVLRAWTGDWHEVAERVGAAWSGEFSLAASAKIPCDVRCEPTPVYAKRPQCVECGRVSRENDRGWTARLTTDDAVVVLVVEAA